MALRAREPFHVWTTQGTGDKKFTAKQSFAKDQVVPAAVAKGRDALVYDDGAAVKK